MFELVLIALALAMDCFAVSVVCGVIIRKYQASVMLRLAVLFGFFQALMPLIGWLLTNRFSQALEAWDHWIAFAMLGFIGVRMILDSFKPQEDKSMNPRELKTQLALSVATSIDALAVGISFACTGYETIGQLSIPLLLIGLTSFAMAVAGFLLGVRFGDVVNRKVKPELLGGLILLAIGIKILIEHTGILAAAAIPGSNPEAIPQAPDYTQSSSWYVVDNDADIDLFYVCSTETMDYQLPDGTLCHYANAADTAACPGMRMEFRGVNRRLNSGNLNFYAPFYRQITRECYYDLELMTRSIPTAMSDVRAAFKEYLLHKNPDRPFVLAGFSQGAQGVMEIMKDMPDAAFKRLVAAYAIGWRITEQDLKEDPRLHPAQGAYDTGVVVNYNSVRSVADSNPLIDSGNVVAINPLNWKTDDTPATLGDTLTVHLDPASHLLIVDGYTRTDYVHPPLFTEGCYHSFEIRWYSESLRKNIQDRCTAFLNLE